MGWFWVGLGWEVDGGPRLTRAVAVAAGAMEA